MQQIIRLVLVDLPPVNNHVSLRQLSHFHAAISPAGVKGPIYQSNLGQGLV